MSAALTVRELLSGNGVDAFDPLSIDTSEIRTLSESIPKDYSIDINQVEILATKFLRAGDMCGELLAIASCHASKCDTAKKKAYSYAAMVKATAAGIKTDKSRSMFADGDDDYIEACNRYSEAQAFAKWIDSKHASFTRAHYMMKEMLKRYYSQEQASGFNCSTDKVIEEEQKNNPNSWTDTEDEQQPEEPKDEFDW